MNIGSLLRRLVDARDDVGIPYMIAGSFASGLSRRTSTDARRRYRRRSQRRCTRTLRRQSRSAALLCGHRRSPLGVPHAGDVRRHRHDHGLECRRHHPEASTVQREQLSRRRLAQIRRCGCARGVAGDTVIASSSGRRRAVAPSGSSRRREIVAAQRRDAPIARPSSAGSLELDLDDEWALVRD